MSNEVVVVVAGGNPPDPDALLQVPLGVPVIAADKGLEHAISLGLEVTVAVGDFDSTSPDVVARAEAAGTTIERHPAGKDATDLELALERALSMSPERVIVLSGDGGRLDHLLSTLLLLGSNRYEDVEIDAAVGRARVCVVRRQRTIAGTPGEIVSLLPLHGPAEGVHTEGLAYALAGETLEPGSSRGVSNVFSADRARVTLERGTLLTIQLPATDRDSP
ncbi:MAG TPA: thiamine diphosphokinase [Gaiellaceae bacterium]|nr:thiamine diphosphokinase [Gaiellaceae bacterium]